MLQSLGLRRHALQAQDHHLGELNTARDAKLAKQAEDLDWNADYSDIRVLVGSTPDGVHLNDGGNSIEVEEAVAGRYTVLGTASSVAGETNMALVMLWYAPVHDSESVRTAHGGKDDAPRGRGAPYGPCARRELGDRRRHDRQQARDGGEVIGTAVRNAAMVGYVLRDNGPQTPSP